MQEKQDSWVQSPVRNTPWRRAQQPTPVFLPGEFHGERSLLLLLLLSRFSHVQLCKLWVVAHQTPLSMGFSRQEHWSGLLCPPPGDLPDPGVRPGSPVASALAGRLFKTEPVSSKESEAQRNNGIGHLSQESEAGFKFRQLIRLQSPYSCVMSHFVKMDMPAGLGAAPWK